MRRIDLIVIVAVAIVIGICLGAWIVPRDTPTKLDVVCKRLDMPACMDVAENTYPNATDIRLRVEPKP